jgi:glycosyltransferase involved in cell wall biosynthesis
VRVGLNATCFNERPSGARQRFIGIYGALIALRPDIEFVIYEPVDCAVAGWFGGAANVVARPTPVPSSGRLRKLVASLGFWNKQLASDRLDLFEAFNMPVFGKPRCSTIFTIHDVREIRDNVPRPQRDFYTMVLRRELRRVDHIITVSDTMRKEIAQIAPGTPITRIYNGIDPSRFRGADPAALAATTARLGVPQGFALAVGHLEERKNFLRLVEAFALLRDSGRTLPLLIVGNDGGSRSEIAAAVARHGLETQISLLQGVTDEELCHLYALSRLVVFPSRYEGFGIPVLEAMAAHRPLVTSDIAVFQELTEGRGAYFPPDDASAIAAQIARLLDDQQLASDLVRYGDTRIADFGFPSLAAQLSALYQTLV